MNMSIWKLGEVKLLKYKEPEQKQLLKRLKVRGSGIEGDPYIVDKADYFPKDNEISILNSNLFIRLENCVFTSFNDKS